LEICVNLYFSFKTLLEFLYQLLVFPNKTMLVMLLCGYSFSLYTSGKFLPNPL
jgi:hypothetical protein